MMAQRRFQRHTGSLLFGDENYFFSKDKLLPKALPESFIRQKLCNLVNRVRFSGFFIWIVGLSIFIFVVFLLYHYLTALLEPRSVGPGRLNEFSDAQTSVVKPASGEQGEIVFSFHNDEDSGLISNWRDGNSDLPSRINELHRIRNSVLTELRQLEKRREELKIGIRQESQKLETLQNSVNREERQLSNVRSAIEQAKVAHHEAVRQQTPEISLPAKLMPIEDDFAVPLVSELLVRNCTMENCFDFSRCSITAGLTVYVYEPSTNAGTPVRKAYDALVQNTQVVSNPSEACVFLVLQEETVSLDSLQYWKGQGGNHLVVALEESSTLKRAKQVKHNAAMKASASSGESHFDFTIPPILNFDWNRNELWQELQPLLPSSRKYLITFWGEYVPSNFLKADDVIRELVVDNLKKIQATKTDDKIFFRTNCGRDKSGGEPGGWALCDNQKARRDLLKHSKFSLIFSDAGALLNGKRKTSQLTLRRIVESLISGSVLVILGPTVLPFEDRIDWNKIAIRIPVKRITELHFILRSYSDADFLELKRHGRAVFEQYLATVDSVLDALLASLRYRLFLPGIAAIAKQTKRSGAFADGSLSPPESQVTEMPMASDPEEYLGPVEPPFPSLTFTENFSQLTMHSYSIWNQKLNPTNLYPFTPDRIPLPTEAKFYTETSIGFRPLGDGEGGSGKEFSRAIGGNFPREQFTAVVLSYERESVLVGTLQRLNQLPYLNKVVVVWNSPIEPSPDAFWPKLSVPVMFIRPGKNSLNNRFLPFEQIETEAILTIDDDVHLTQAEIIFAFRVWREHRDQIVGFPARYHAWDAQHSSWLYNSNHTCELSMILTGAAFYHKYYSYVYSNLMPSAIREKVDSVMNCEDLAMNFLVSHLTRKPPVKVTSKWTFRCPGCPETLSADESHFLERHDCIQFFTKVYGYNPLLNTQYRVDSVLFKTRIPHQHQKCFKFI